MGEYALPEPTSNAASALDFGAKSANMSLAFKLHQLPPNRLSSSFDKLHCVQNGASLLPYLAAYTRVRAEGPNHSAIRIQVRITWHMPPSDCRALEKVKQSTPGSAQPHTPSLATHPKIGW